MNNKEIGKIYELSEPLLEYLTKYSDPHLTVGVSQEGIKIVRDEVFLPNNLINEED